MTDQMPAGSPPLPPLPPADRAALGLEPEPAAPEPAAEPEQDGELEYLRDHPTPPVGDHDAWREWTGGLKSISPGPATNTGSFESRVTATVGAGREVIRHAGENASSPANAFESRIVPQDGKH